MAAMLDSLRQMTLNNLMLALLRPRVLLFRLQSALH